MEGGAHLLLAISKVEGTAFLLPDLLISAVRAQLPVRWPAALVSANSH